MTSKNKRPKSALPLAFTEHGVVMLSSVLRSDIAVQTSVLITRAFVAMRQMIANSPVIMSAQHQKEMKELKEYIEDVFADQNDINEDTRMQIELINQVLAELQVHKKHLMYLLLRLVMELSKYYQQQVTTDLVEMISIRRLQTT